jgi:predicted nucleic acid-binding protein
MKRIYLDTCVRCRPFDEPSQRVKEEAEAFFTILQGVDEKRFLILGSVVLDDELFEIRDGRKRAVVVELMSRAIAERITVISESKQEELKRATGVEDEDAFHLAAALEGKAEYFLTVDDNVLAKADKIEAFGLKVQNLVDLIEEKK